MTTKKTEPTGPCPPLDENETSDDLAGDPMNLDESAADFDAEETDEA